MTKILYIAGWGRSGTTLLDNLLGQVEGFASAGEIHHIWQRGLVEERACGCGLALRECPVWREAFSRSFGGVAAVDAPRAIGAQRAIRTRNVRSVARTLRRGRTMQDLDYAPYLKGVYDGLVAATGCRVIVDSSKYPVDALVAAGLPGYEVYVLHMVRDPRAVAFSWARRKQVADKMGGAGLLRRAGLVRSTAVWQVYNTLIRGTLRSELGTSRYHALRYERLVAQPASVLDELISFLGEDPTWRPEFDGNDVDMAQSHTASGNPVRFTTGRTSIRLDSEWEGEMATWRKTLVTVLSWPTLNRMGYAVRPTPGRP